MRSATLGLFDSLLSINAFFTCNGFILPFWCGIKLELQDIAEANQSNSMSKVYVQAKEIKDT